MKWDSNTNTGWLPWLTPFHSGYLSSHSKEDSSVPMNTSGLRRRGLLDSFNPP